jgi:hypothetical protein
MWIVLLDHSGSMGEPFEEHGPSTSRTRAVDSEIKLDAAREVLLEEIEEELKAQDPDLELAIFAFTSIGAVPK